MPKKYIPNNSFLICDKGSIPTNIVVTHDNNARLYGERFVNEMDMIPYENIFPFGVCSITGSKCEPQPIFWDKCNQGVKLNGYKLVFEDACLLCKLGGRITVNFEFNVWDYLLKTTSNGAYGVAGTDRQISNFFSNFEDAAQQLRIDPLRIDRDLNFDVDTPRHGRTNHFTGNFGEFKTLQELRLLGYEIISEVHPQNITEPMHNGMDFIARDPRNPDVDILIEAKNSGSSSVDTPAQMNRRTRTGSLQMDDLWLTENMRGTNESRIQNALPRSPEDAARITNKINSGDTEGLQRLAAKTDLDGNIRFYEMDTNGNVIFVDNAGNTPTTRLQPPRGEGPIRDAPQNLQRRTTFELPSANAVRGNSRAANFINNVSNSIQSSNSISSANRYLVNNADQLARVGKVVGRGAAVVGIVIDAGRFVHTAYQDWKDDGTLGMETALMGGDVVGGALGGIAGGAALGAACGLVFGPVGVLVGGIIGGAVGGLLGSKLGRGLVGLFG